MKLPKAKDSDIVVTNAGKELLVYDLITHKAYSLNETSAKVFDACDGKTTFDDLKRKYKFTDDLIYLTLDELKNNSLIAEDYENNHFTGLSRREVIKKVGLASMITLPVIVGLTAPRAAAAASKLANGVSCQGNGDCQSDRCIPTRYVTGSVFFVPGGNKCCVQGGGDYTNIYLAPPGACNFAANCCTGAGTETSPSSCECASTS